MAIKTPGVASGQRRGADGAGAGGLPGCEGFRQFGARRQRRHPCGAETEGRAGGDADLDPVDPARRIHQRDIRRLAPVDADADLGAEIAGVIQHLHQRLVIRQRRRQQLLRAVQAAGLGRDYRGRTAQFGQQIIRGAGRRQAGFSGLQRGGQKRGQGKREGQRQNAAPRSHPCCCLRTCPRLDHCTHPKPPFPHRRNMAGQREKQRTWVIFRHRRRTAYRLGAVTLAMGVFCR